MKPWNKKWTRRKIINGIRKIFIYRRNITPKEIRRDYSALYQIAQRREYYGGWLRAIEAAGMAEKYKRILARSYKTALLKRKKYRAKWSKELIQSQIKYLESKGEPLDGGYIRRHYFNLLHAAGHKRYFGSWRKAVESVGINYNSIANKMLKKPQIVTFVVKDKLFNKMIKAWRREMIDKNYHRLTINMRLRHLKKAIKYWGNIGIRNISSESIKHFIYSLGKRGLSPITIKSTLSSVQHFFLYCLKYGGIAKDPFDNIHLPQNKKCLPKVLSEEEMRSFLACIGTCQSISENVRTRDRLIIELIAYCGLRRKELVNLKRKNVNLIDRWLKVEQGKFRKDRIVPLSNDLVNNVRKYLKLRGPCHSHYLITNIYNNRKMDETAINRIFLYYGSLSGLKHRITPHILRNTFATLLFEGGAQLRSIQELMGHADIDTTSKYIRVSVDHLRKEIQKHPMINEYYNSTARTLSSENDNTLPVG
ncbi:MAG: tyrosine-type recombinase/integrase [Candidatus Margulisiibacteriota bacterium]